MIEREKLLEECQPVLRENDLSSDYFQGRVRGVRDTLPKILRTISGKIPRVFPCGKRTWGSGAAAPGPRFMKRSSPWPWA